MPLSPKKIYKQPQVAGASLYEIEISIEQECQDQGFDTPISGMQTENSRQEENIALWPQPGDSDYVGESEAEADDHEQRQDPSDAEEALDDAGESQQKKEKKKSPEEIAEAILEERMEQCVEEGYEKGRKKAEDECRKMREEAQKKLKEAEECLMEARSRSKEIVAASEQKIVELSVAVAERLVHKQLEIDPEAITGIVRETLNILNGGEQVEIYVNPNDHDVCLEQRENLKEEFTEIIKLDLVADERVPSGSCRVESESGVAEYLLGEEKKQLEQMLLNVAREEAAEQAEEKGLLYDKH